jgi:hypothetical protein
MKRLVIAYRRKKAFSFKHETDLLELGRNIPSGKSDLTQPCDVAELFATFLEQDDPSNPNRP